MAVDGKTLRHSFEVANNEVAIHIVSAWVTANHLSLGQVVTDENSNKIMVIPKLLKVLEIKGVLVTVDAMGCQREVAKKSVHQQTNTSWQ